jgi:rare lipoprotein A
VICVTLAGCVVWGGDAKALVTWYGPGFYGQPTASGIPYDPNKFTAAHPTLPFGSQVEVNGITATVIDRCACQLDLSEAAAEAAGVKDEGGVAASQTATSHASTITELPRTGGITYEEAKEKGYVT